MCWVTHVLDCKEIITLKLKDTRGVVRIVFKIRTAQCHKLSALVRMRIVSGLIEVSAFGASRT